MLDSAASNWGRPRLWRRVSGLFLRLNRGFLKKVVRLFSRLFFEVFAKQPEYVSNGTNEPHKEDRLYEAIKSPGRRGGVSMINASWPDSFQANSKVDAPYR